MAFLRGFLKLVPLILMFVFSSAVLTGCPDQEQQRKPMSPPVKIGVSLADMERDGNQVIKKVMEENKKREQVQIIWQDAGNDPRKQEEQLKDMLKQKVKAVVIQVVNPADGPRLVQQLVEQDIKVVALETLPPNTPFDAYVASDHSRAGQLLARFLNESIQRAAEAPPPQVLTPEQAGVQVRPEDNLEDVRVNWGSEGPPPGMEQTGQGQGGGGEQGQQQGSQQQGQQGQQQQGGQQLSKQLPPEQQIKGRTPLNVVIMQGDPRDPALRDIAAATRTALQGNPQVNVVKVMEIPGNQPSQIPALLQQVFSENGNRIDAILASDSKFAVAAADTIKTAGLNTRVLTAGVGADKQSFTAMMAGEHDAEVDTMPEMLANYAMDAALTLARGENWQYDTRIINGDYSVPARITPVRLVQKENIYLLQQRWGKQQDKKQEQQGGQAQQGAGGDQQSQDQQGQKQQGQDQQGQGQQGQQGGQQQGQQGKTTLRITTQDGKTVEVQIDGRIQKIESVDGGGQQGQQGQGGGQGGSQGGGGQSGGGS